MQFVYTSLVFILLSVSSFGQGITILIDPGHGGSDPGHEAADKNLLPEKEEVLAADVEIHDNRPVYKKIASGFASISGSLVGADGLLTKNPLIAPIVLAVILLLIIFRYGRKPIMRLIRRKKDGDKGN